MDKLTKGTIAPSFTLPDSEEKLVSLEDFKGKWLVLYFYPKDNTPGCTIEAKDFTCLLDDFRQLNIEIIGISKDSAASHQKFIAKHNLNLTLLSDTELTVMKQYAVWREKNLYGKTALGVVRSTFLINPNGNIQDAWYNVRAKNHAEKILSHCRALLEKRADN